MRRRPEKHDREEVPSLEFEHPENRRVTHQRRHCARGPTDNDVLCRRPFQQRGVKHHVERRPGDRQRCRQDVGEKKENRERRDVQDHSENQRVHRFYPTASHGTMVGSMHLLVDILLVPHVQRTRASRRKCSADEHHHDVLPRRDTPGSNERSTQCREQQQRHHPRLGQDQVVQNNARHRP